jgi:nucleoside-triphosphatase THEP1
MINIFLTGPVNIGKSTIVNTVLDDLQAAGVHKIRGHKDVILFEITDTNRDRLPNKILKIIKTEMGI